MTKDSKGCSVLIAANITAQVAPPVITNSIQTFNNSATVANIKASGSYLRWYDALINGKYLLPSTLLKTGKYYVSQTINNCESTRASVEIIVEQISVGEQIPTDGLIAYYPFNGNANDVSGNKSNALSFGATLTSDRFGKANNAYRFNGSTDYMNASIPNIPIGNSSRTISGWFKTDNPFSSSNKHEVCIFNYGNLENVQRLALSIYSKGYLQTITGADFSNNDFYINNYNYSNNDWYFLHLPIMDEIFRFM